MSVEITIGKGGHPRYKEVSDYGKLATKYSNTDINLAITYLEKIKKSEHKYVKHLQSIQMGFIIPI